MNKSKQLLGLIEQDTEEEPKGKDISGEVIKFLRENPNPDDDKVHELADQLGIEAHDLEPEFYKLATAAASIGKHRDVPDDEFDADELVLGIEVEAEHVDDPVLRKEIAKDHLVEMKNYYTRLKKMEGGSHGDKEQEKD